MHESDARRASTANRSHLLRSPLLAGAILGLGAVTVIASGLPASAQPTPQSEGERAAHLLPLSSAPSTDAPATWAEGAPLVAHGGFIEKEDGRRLAHLTLRLTPAGDRAKVELEVSAQGQGVLPEPGWQGLRGANVVTAREIHALLQDDALRAEILDASGEVLVARLDAGALRHTPMRRRGADGMLEHEGQSDEAYVDAFHVRRRGLAPGSYRVHVYAKEELRLEVPFSFDAETAEVSGFHTLGGLHRLPEVDR